MTYVLDLLPQLDPPALCSVAWSFAASGVANPDWWVGLSYEVLTRVSYDVPKDQQALLYEAFTAAAELAHVRLDDQAFSDLLESYKSNWSPRRLEVSKKVNVAALLKALQEDFSQDVAVKGLYIMPYLLRRSAVIVCPVKCSVERFDIEFYFNFVADMPHFSQKNRFSPTCYNVRAISRPYESQYLQLNIGTHSAAFFENSYYMKIISMHRSKLNT